MRAAWSRAAIVTTIAACSGKSPCSGLPRGADEVSERACADWATHYCRRLEVCAPVSLQVGYGDEDRCVARSRPACAAALSAPGTGATPDSLRRCAEAYDSAACDDVVVGRPPRACAVAGALAAGAPCVDDAQCASAHCRVPADRACGSCVARGAVGDACDSDRDCQYGLVCYFSCLEPVALGAPCDGMTRQCPQTLVCYDYACSRPADRGAPCDPRADRCDRDHGLYCDPDSKSCSPLSVVDVGGACGAGTLCRGGSCATDEATGASRCVANASDGEPCDAAGGPVCALPSRCVEGLCRLLDPARCR